MEGEVWVLNCKTMKKFTSTFIIINISLSVLFLVLDFYALFAEERNDKIPFVFFSYFLLMFVCFICTAIYLFKLQKTNKQQLAFTKVQIMWGNTLAVMNIILAASLVFFILVGAAVFKNFATQPQISYWYIYAAFLLLLLIAALTAIFNAVNYFLLKKENRKIVNTLVNNIGNTK